MIASALARGASVTLAVIALAFAVFAPAPSSAAEVPIPPSPTTYVTDVAAMLDGSTRQTLEQRLSAYDRETGHQVIVYIGQTTGDTPLEDWTIRAFSAWKPGRKGLDDGLALFMFSQDRKVRIEVGYGLESVVTDAAASNIIRNVIVPRMREGDPNGAVTAGVSALLATIGGEAGAPPVRSYSGKSADDNFWVVGLAFAVIFVILALFARGGGRHYTIGSGPAIFGGGWGGWSGGGGGGGFSGGGFGGFSGGGGGGGGGGASGGW